MKYYKVISVVALAFFLSAPSVQAGVSGQELQEARALVEKKDYDKALGEYEKISDQLRSDPGLLIEWARVYTYTNRHAQAITLFEEARTKYPQQEKNILRELADQYKWDGKLKQAIDLYRRDLETDPQNL